MKMQKYFYSLIIVFMSILSVHESNAGQLETQVVAAADDNWKHALPQNICESITSGKIVSIAAYFSQSVEVSLPQSDSHVYSRKQAEVVIGEFFAKLSGITYKIENERTMGNATMTTGLLKANGASYRLFIMHQPSGGKTSISQMRIEYVNK